jgi:hypothetical protein
MIRRRLFRVSCWFLIYRRKRSCLRAGCKKRGTIKRSGYGFHNAGKKKPCWSYSKKTSFCRCRKSRDRSSKRSLRCKSWPASSLCRNLRSGSRVMIFLTWPGRRRPGHWLFFSRGRLARKSTGTLKSARRRPVMIMRLWPRCCSAVLVVKTSLPPQGQQSPLRQKKASPCRSCSEVFPWLSTSCG